MRKRKLTMMVLGSALALSVGLSGCKGSAGTEKTGTAAYSGTVSESGAVSESGIVSESGAVSESAEMFIPVSEGNSETKVGKEIDLPNQSDQGFQDNFSVDDQSVTDFAERVKAAVKEKDKEGLAKLMSFPVYIGLPDGKGGAIGTMEEYMALSDDDIFSDAMLSSMKDAKDTGLSASMAGFTLMGEGDSQRLPSITFGVVNGELKIVGMNY